MPRFQWLLVLFLLGYLPGGAALAQTPADPGALRFSHTLESRRAEALESSRRDAAAHFLAVSEKIVSLREGSEIRRTELLGDAQYLADSITLLDQQIEEVTPAVREARRNLIGALRAQVTTLRQDAEAADPQRRPGLEAQIQNLEAELGGAVGPGRLDRPCRSPFIGDHRAVCPWAGRERGICPTPNPTSTPE